MRQIKAQPADPYRTIRLRLFSINIGALVFVWVTLIVIVYSLMATELYSILDDQLRGSATRIIEHYDRHAPYMNPIPIGLGDQQQTFSLFTVTTSGVKWTAEFLDGNPFINAQSMYKEALKSPQGIFTTFAVEGQPYRAFLALVQTRTNTYLIRVLRPTAAVQSTLDRLLSILSVAGLAALGLSIGIGLWLTARSVRPMIASWRRQQQFVADASHELRTPLAIIRTNLEVALRNPGHTIGSEMQYLGNAYAETQSTAILVENLLTLARADSKQQLIEKEPVDLKSLVQDVVDSIEPMAQDTGKEVLAVVPASPCSTRGDMNRLRQLLLILLDNALKYSDPGARVTMTLECDTLRATLQVSDTGHGIDPKFLPHIFERFVRGDASRHRNAGSGLGLAIAHWIVQAHGGEISASSKLGQGSVFTVTLPN